MAGFDREALADLAQILVNQQLTPTDADAAWKIYSFLQITKSKGALGRDNRLLALEAEIASRNVRDSSDLAVLAAKWEVTGDGDQLTFYEANSLVKGKDPTLPLSADDTKEWLGVVSAMYQKVGMLPLKFSVERPAPDRILDSLATHVTPGLMGRRRTPG